MSSLFGGFGSTTNNNNTAANNTASSTSSFFSGKTLVPSASSTLGSNNNTAAAGSTGASSLFGGNTAPKPAGASLFGGGSAGAANNTSGASLFSGGGGVNASTTGASSLFGGNAASKPASTSLFGGGAASNASASQPGALSAPAANASLFSDGILKRQDSEGEIAVPQSTATANPAYFDALLQRGRKRRADEHNGAFGELPQLQLGLQDISHKVRNLGKNGPSGGLSNGTDVRAHYLLAASGVDTAQAQRDLQELTGRANPVSLSVANDLLDPSGVKGVLAQRHQTDFQKMVDAHVAKAHDEFDRMIEEKLHGVDWDAHRQRVYEHFGLKKPRNLDGTQGPTTGSFGRSSRRGLGGGSASESTFGLPGLSRSIIGTPGLRNGRTSMFADVAEKTPADGLRPAPEDRAMRLKQETFSNRIKDLNVARIGGKVYPILQKFSEVEAEPSNEDTSMLVHAYNALIDIVGEDASKDSLSDPGAIRERQYAAAYLDDNLNSAAQTSIRKRIINGSRNFLENLFFSQLELTVGRNPKEANVGGVPTPIAKVKGYVRVRASRKELGPDIDILQEVNGDYCWPVLMYCLRSGLYKEALEYVEENAPAFRQIDRSFMRYLRAYVASEDHRLPAEMQTAINNEYSQRSRLAPEDSIDPYRMVCYRIIGRCELQKRSLSAISNDMMDWLWFQLALAREYNRIDEFAHEAFGLDELRASIKEIGEKWFGPGSDVANAPSTLFFMQITAGMFEKAVADLYAHNYVSATHFAIALDFYGLLRVSDISNSNDLLSHTTRNQPQIAFGSMIGLYTRDFRTADATAAVDYLALICLNDDLSGELGKRQRELCHQALTEVVLETREFAQLLGDIRSDGQRIKGAIEQRLMLIGLENEQDFLRHITLVAARTAEDQSRVTDAALLYHLGEDYDKVAEVVSEALSVALTTDLGEQPIRLTPLKPRIVPDNRDKQTQEQERSSLSLTALDDPIAFSRAILKLYGEVQMYYASIRGPTKDSCMILLRLAAARDAVENSDWPLVIDEVTSGRVLPIEANGNMSAIRAAATAFSGLPVKVSRTIGYVLLWTVLACARNIERLRAAEFQTGTQQATINTCIQISKDVMVFAGLIRFKLPGRVWESLAQIAGETGAF